MRLVVQAIVTSIFIHLTYIICTLGYGYVKTKFYKPDISGQWGSVDYLQDEVTFGMIISPSYLGLTLIGTALLSGVIIYLYKRFFC